MFFMISLSLFLYDCCMKKFSSYTQQIGELGENVAVQFLVRKGFVIVERNYTRKWGEIDIIARKGSILYFIEVKSVSREIIGGLRPEDHLDWRKQERLRQTIGIYINTNRVGKWQFDLVCVYLDHTTRRARVKVISDLIL
jgi:putative endonuclease